MTVWRLVWSSEHPMLLSLLPPAPLPPTRRPNNECTAGGRVAMAPPPCSRLRQRPYHRPGMRTERIIWAVGTRLKAARAGGRDRDKRPGPGRRADVVRNQRKSRPMLRRAAMRRRRPAISAPAAAGHHDGGARRATSGTGSVAVDRRRRPGITSSRGRASVRDAASRNRGSRQIRPRLLLVRSDCTNTAFSSYILASRRAGLGIQ